LQGIENEYPDFFFNNPIKDYLFFMEGDKNVVFYNTKPALPKEIKKEIKILYLRAFRL